MADPRGTPPAPVGPVPPHPGEPPSERAPSPDEAPQRLHPFGIVRGISIRSLAPLLPALFVAGSQLDLAFLAIGTIAVVVGTVVRVISWTRHTYELRGGRIIERSGLLSRTERALEIERIQQIDVERTLLDRAVGTCELRMETAADSGDSELTLTVVTLEEAERLRAVLAAASARLGARPAATETSGADGGEVAAPVPDAGDLADGPPPETRLIAVPLPHVAFAAVTGPRLLVVPAGIAVIAGTIAEAYQPEADDPGQVASEAADIASSLGVAAIIALVLIGIVVSFVAAAVVGLLRDGGFEIVERGREIVVRRGLTTTRTATVPLRRIQRISIRRSWIHGLAGFATMTIHTAGSVARGSQGDPQASLNRSLTIPLLPTGDVDRMLRALLGTSDVPRLAPHPVAARRRMVLRAVGSVTGPVVGAVAFLVISDLPEVALAVSVVLFGGAIAVGVARYGRLATGIGDELVAGRTGLVGTTTVLAPRRKVQGVSVRSSWFQRRRELATAAVHVAGPSGGLVLPDLGTRTATGIARSLT